MSDYNGLRPGEILADASVADFISSLGLGIARAQQALDTNSIEQLDAFIQPLPGLGGKTLIEMGFSPAFYHYQHADISCSMNLRLKVEESTGVDLGLNGAYNSTGTQDDNSDSSSSSSSSGSSQSTSSRQASLQMTARSAGQVSLNGNQVSLSGDDLDARLNSLVDGLAGNADINAVAFTRTQTPINPTTDADPNMVKVSANAVAFTTFGHAVGVIRIVENSDTTFVANPQTTLTVSRSTSVENYARKVMNSFTDEGFTVVHWKPGEPMHEVLFNTDRNNIRSDQQDRLDYVGQHMARTGVAFQIVGHADAPGTPEYNLELSKKRAEEVRRQLLANGVKPEQILEVRGDGEAAANPDNAEGVGSNSAHRRVAILLGVNLLDVTGGVFSNVEPDRRDHSQPNTNGWLATLKDPDLASLNGKRVTADNRSWTLSGSAVAGFAENSAQALAKNLANSINADEQSQISASSGGAACHLARESEPVNIQLASSSSRNLTLTSSDSITISEQFSRSQSQRVTQQRTGNTTMAFGGTLDVRDARKFELDVTGNSSISARLVSIPAPPEFLDTIRSYLKD